MKLYSSPSSPYVRKVMVAAHEVGLADRLELAAVGKQDRLYLVGPDNPLAKIPTLVTDDGVALFDSPVICEYLDHLANGGVLFPAGGPERWAALKLQALGDGVMDAAWLVSNERQRPEEFRWSDWIAKQQSKVTRSMDLFEQDIGLLGDTVTIGTLTVACAITYVEFRSILDGDWRTGRPKLADWQAAFSDRPSMLATVYKD